MNRQEMIESTPEFAVSFGREMTSVSSWHFCAVPPVLNPAESLPESNLGSRAPGVGLPNHVEISRSRAQLSVPGNLLRVGFFNREGSFSTEAYSLWFCCGLGSG